MKHPSRNQSFAIAFACLVLAFVLGSFALDTGSLWQYALCFALVIGAIRHFVRAIKNEYGDGKK